MILGSLGSERVETEENFAFEVELGLTIKTPRNTREKQDLVTRSTVEPRFNEPLYSEALGITNDIFHPSNSVMYGKEPRYNESSI